MLRIADIEFIRSAAEYLNNLDMEPICITREGENMPFLVKHWERLLLTVS